MRYILLALALIVPQFAATKSVFTLNETQLDGIAECSCDGALEGAMIGFIAAYEVYDRQDYSDKDITEKIKLFRWYYPVIGATACALIAIQADYLTCALMNSIDNHYKPQGD